MTPLPPVNPSAQRLARRQASVLVIAPQFPPPWGDLSIGIREFCEELAKQGSAVTVATWEEPAPAKPVAAGIHLIPLSRHGVVDGVPSWIVVLRRLVGSGLFSTCVLYANPADLLPWAFLNLKLPGATRLIVRLLIDRADTVQALGDPSLRQRFVSILRQSSATLVLTQTGPDRAFVDAEKVPAIHLPHAVRRRQPEKGFRERNGIAADSFLVLMPGEVGVIKNQLGVIQALRGVSNDWKVLFASPVGADGSAVGKRFVAELAQDQTFLPYDGQSEGELAAALAAADVVVCASPYERAPRELLAAMAHARPWLALKECSLATDLAGGICCALADFRETLTALRNRPDLCNRLGEAGERHWQQCYSWEAVAPAWRELLTSGTTRRAFDLPHDLRVCRQELDREVGEAVRGDRRQFVAGFGARPQGFSFCIITDGQEPGKLRLEIDSIRAQGLTEYEILLGGSIPPGFGDVSCFDMVDAAQGGRLGYMRNRLVEKTRYAMVVVADDDMLFHPGFTEGIMSFPDDYDVLCVRILNTDNTRFWDWAVYGSPTGHHLIDYDALDPFVYVTGGMCVMRWHVSRLVQWSDRLGFYQFEDIDFSRKINAQGLRIRFCENSAVTHNDDRYYGNNYQVGKRTDTPLPPPPAR